MALIHCKRCRGNMELVKASFRAPEHFRCINCGHYVETPFQPVMPEIPPPTVLVINQYSKRPALSKEERTRRSREAQRRYRLELRERA